MRGSISNIYITITLRQINNSLDLLRINKFKKNIWKCVSHHEWQIKIGLLCNYFIFQSKLLMNDN